MKRSFKKRLQTWCLTIATFVAIFVLYFGYKIIVILLFQPALNRINPPFDFDAAISRLQKQKVIQHKEHAPVQQERQDETDK